ncbi:MAG TPA: hypothetical protein VFV66_13345 [Nonomuraea sp.]|nr:hypothetical protein [Nonomuraea sp.]
MFNVPVLAGVLGLLALAVMLIVGIVLMAMRRHEHGRGAVIGIVGCVVLLLGAVFNIAQSLLVQSLVDLAGLGVAITVTTLISTGFTLVGTGLLIGAVVIRREPRQPAAPSGMQPSGPQPSGPYQPGPYPSGPYQQPGGPQHTQQPHQPQPQSQPQPPQQPQWGQGGWQQPPQG